MKIGLFWLKKVIKNCGPLCRICLKAQEAFFCGATLLSPELNTRLQYRKVFHRWPDLEKPGTFNEKLLWLKLQHMEDPLVIRCADKYLVREYVRDCGCGQYLNRLYGVYDRTEEIPWDELPDRFVVKWNFGAGMNIVCPDKEKLDIGDTVRTLERWRGKKVWLPYAEMQYKYAPKKLICEEFLDDGSASGSLTDYKVYCFHGKPEAILVMHDRSSGVRTEFFDPSWKKLKNTSKYDEPRVPTPEPRCLAQMLEAAERLSRPFAFVRCDFYIVKDRLVFGEMTFTPAGGLYLAQTEIDGKAMGDFLRVP